VLNAQWFYIKAQWFNIILFVFSSSVDIIFSYISLYVMLLQRILTDILFKQNGFRKGFLRHVYIVFFELKTAYPEFGCIGGSYEAPRDSPPLLDVVRKIYPKFSPSNG